VLMTEDTPGYAPTTAAVQFEGSTPGAHVNGQPCGLSMSGLGAREIRRQEGLVLRAQTGDPDALTQLHAEHAERVYRYFVGRLGGRAELAEDLTAEVFLRMLQRLGRYEYRGLPFSAWLFRIAHNLLIDHIRTQPRVPLLPLDAAQRTPAPLGEAAFRRVDSKWDLAQALAQLTATQRQVVELRFVAGLSVADAAAVVGKTEDAVKKLQARGLLALRKVLLDSGADSPTSVAGNERAQEACASRSARRVPICQHPVSRSRSAD